ncbi:MAG TPA: MraY family glycosyltransferase [Candidatus Baltobacteraceae bacterium]|jgi:UDP-GlcNAc:undecaprenyl-phosphate GlcNAc-1-phosphate transferase|nr:MraY family glycosyltransferase [Candidatus Baltobacteraceae bacterium]
MTPTAYLYASAFFIAGVASGVLTPFIIKLAHHVGMIDQVDERRMHDEPKPRIGGIAVFFGFAFALFAVLGIALSHLHGFFPVDPHESRQAELRDQLTDAHNLVGLLFGSMLILGVGLWDDIMGMRPRYKFAAQIVVAGISMIYGFMISGIENPISHQYVDFPLWLAAPLTLLWYLGMMNAINFIDGLDGLLSGFTAISCIFLFAIALTKGNPVVALVVIALAGAALGFLPYNFNPARIILGDTGSLFIGFVFATVAIIGTSKTAIAVGLIAPLVVLALPIIDTAAAIYRRARSGKKITEADRGHFHHQLIFRYGLNVRQAVLLIYAICIVLGAVALFLAGGFAPFLRTAAL